MQIKIRDENDMYRFAQNLGPFLKRGDVLALSGTLGIGKTVFARALIRALCNNANMDVPSPTFTLVQFYDSNPPLWHFDLYRLESPEEIHELGWEDALYEGISVIEWPERLDYLAPEDRLEIVFRLSEDNDDARLLELNYPQSWETRFKEKDLHP